MITLNNGYKLKAAKTSETSVKIEKARIFNVIGLIKFKVLKDNLEVENSIKSVYRCNNA